MNVQTATQTKTLPKLMKASYLGPEEDFIWEGRPSGYLYFPLPIFVLALVVLGNLSLWAGMAGSPIAGLMPAFVTGLSIYSIWVIGGLVLLLLAILFLAERWFKRATTIFAVTSTRLIRRKGILSKDFDEIQMRQIRGIHVKQRILQRLLGYGTVRLSAEAGGPNSMGNEDWPGFPKPVDFQKTVESAQERLSGVREIQAPQAIAATP
jgi:uncharacterized membrane protein YdbT with pleckstrin-like domain